MGITPELAEKMLIKFSGDKDKLYEFIDNCDRALSLVSGANKTTVFSIILTKLTDKARALTRNKDFTEWKDLKKFLLDTYGDKRTMGQWQLELNSCKQSFNETVIAYSSRIEDYYRCVRSLDENLSTEGRNACIELLKNQTLNVFINGLRKELALIVKSQKPNSLSEAISLAVNEERDFKSRLDIQKFQQVFRNNDKLPQPSGKFVHKTFPNSNYKTQPSASTSNQFMKTFNPDNREYPVRHFTHRRQPRANFDANQNCRQEPPMHPVVQPKFCNYCKKPNHLISECRKRAYNNARNARNATNVPSQNINYLAHDSLPNNEGTSASSQSSNNYNINLMNSEENLNAQGSRANVAAPRTFTQATFF
ncbi:uncharacterized protein LOC116173032 [Photinus pyralis]|uniref:uncharacterized protein LOC116173032 n=1 Tax=Photinus pyralis TaxID=7054 RepID=UPI0012677843|nr:uncharacterized protein LOC116173032 [Photinus pyralis]